MGNLIIFFKIPPILKLEVGFFSGKKKFFRDFPNLSTFILSELHICKFEKKSENLFGSGAHSLSAPSGLRCQARGVVVRCTRLPLSLSPPLPLPSLSVSPSLSPRPSLPLPPLSCSPPSLSHPHPLSLAFPRFQKKCLLPMGILIFFF